MLPNLPASMCPRSSQPHFHVPQVTRLAGFQCLSPSRHARIASLPYHCSSAPLQALCIRALCWATLSLTPTEILHPPGAGAALLAERPAGDLVAAGIIPRSPPRRLRRASSGGASADSEQQAVLAAHGALRPGALGLGAAHGDGAGALGTAPAPAGRLNVEDLLGRERSTDGAAAHFEVPHTAMDLAEETAGLLGTSYGSMENVEGGAGEVGPSAEAVAELEAAVAVKERELREAQQRAAGQAAAEAQQRGAAAERAAAATAAAATAAAAQTEERAREAARQLAEAGADLAKQEQA